MSHSTEEAILDLVEADNRAVLYEARWNDETACQIIPKLIQLLGSKDRDVLLRAFSAFITIASRAHAAAEKLIPYLRSKDLLLAHNSILALARVSLDHPELAIDPLMSAADIPELAKPAMQALIYLGASAKRAAPIFIRAFGHPSAEIRCLALRGLAEIKAEQDSISPVLQRAATDKSRRVREYAAKKFLKLIAR